MHTHTYTNTHTHTLHTHTTYSHSHAHTHTHTHTHIHTHKHIHKYTHTYTHKHTNRSENTGGTQRNRFRMFELKLPKIKLYLINLAYLFLIIGILRFMKMCRKIQISVCKVAKF